MKAWIAVRGPARITGADDKPVEDPAVLRALDGVRPDLSGDELADFVPPDLLACGISGGPIGFIWADDKLWVETRYDLKRDLTDAELLALVSYTLGQWADGFSTCATGLGPPKTAVSIWREGDGYTVSTSASPVQRPVSWQLVTRDDMPRRVAAFAP